MTVRVTGNRTVVAAAFVLTILASWTFTHTVFLVAALHGHGPRYAALFAVTFALLVWQQALAYLERPFVTTPRQDRMLRGRRIAVSVPVYNEDDVALQRTIASLLAQSRLPDVVHVVNDGSTDPSATERYPAVRAWAEERCAAAGIDFAWFDKPNGGKRSAQAVTFGSVDDADFFVTVDSDAILDPRAIEEVVKPFANARVTSVAGVVMASNNRGSVLCRITDLLYVGFQLTSRSSLSTMRSVLVNSGPLAAYRADVIRRHLDGYLRETFLGRRVEFSDDSLLTLYAATEGHTVQQPSALVLCLMPDKVGHHLRQYLRWMRGSTIRSIWRARYLPKRRYGYWANLLTWWQLVVAWIVFGVLVVTQPLLRHEWSQLPWLALVTAVLGYLQSLRYLVIDRSDEPVASRVLTWLLSPVATVWAFTVLRALRVYGMATCWKTGWGTRETVEVRMEAAA